jgi:ABC-type nickel/cobalt efflux system permease component RcnA
MSDDSFHTQRSDLDPPRLWAGGVASAIVAGLVAVAGVLTARGIFKIDVLAPTQLSLWADTWSYALVGFTAAIAATALRYLLSMATPSPEQFFNWIAGTSTLIAVVLPLTSDADLWPQIATAVINLALGGTITILVSSTAASARRVRG